MRWVPIFDPFIIFYQECITVHSSYIFRQEGDFASASGQINGKMRHAQTRGISLQSADDFFTLGKRCPEVRGAFCQVCLEHIVWAYPDGQKLFHKCPHNLKTIVYPLEYHGLASDRDAGVGEPLACKGRKGGDFAGMIKMSNYIEWVKFFQHTSEPYGYPVGKCAWDPCPDPYDFHVGYVAQSAQDLVKFFIFKQEGVPSR